MINSLITQINLEKDFSYLIVTENGKVADQIFNQLRFIKRFFAYSWTVDLFPGYETLPYENLMIADDLLYQRLATLNQIRQRPQVIITEISTLMRKLPPAENLPKGLNLSQEVTFTTLKQVLVQNDFINVSQVTAPKEYAIRGGIIDLYIDHSPYRLAFEDEQLKNIWLLDPETQRSGKKVKEVVFFPAHEVTLDELTLKRFKDNWQLYFQNKENTFYNKVVQHCYHTDLENYLPLFYSHMVALTDYFVGPLKVLTLGNLASSGEKFSQLVQQQYQNRIIDEPITLPPEQLFFSHLAIKAILDNLPSITVTEKQIGPLDYEIYISNSNYYLETLKLPSIQTFRDLIPTQRQYALFDDRLSENFTLCHLDYNIVFQTKFTSNVSRTLRTKEFSKQLNIDLNQLSSGDLIVHRNYGIGRFIALQQEALGDFIVLEYAHQDKLYVASDQLHLISRYLGSNQVSLSALSNKNWEKTKQNAQKRIQDLAMELLALQAKRQTLKKPIFTIPAEYQSFKANCPFTLSKDQETILEEIKQDFVEEQLMDRLICGDVGFGKTELAMHAAFLAVYNNQQVILIAPTTILVNQHLETFKRRFLSFPVNIKALTRHHSILERRQLLEEFNDQKIDILITTLTFFPYELKHLGLLIIDEEHRFGVKQKEHFKRWVTALGILSLTATPIPRSLNLAMLGIRQFSLLQTPPAKKLSVKTIVSNYDVSVIQRAIQRELLRGGQVYFVHNRIGQLPHFYQILSKMFPEIKIAILHSQSKNSLQTMQLFLRQEIDLLICTNLIEAGLDVKNANTIIVNQADLFGIADLHQLRGRVGRFHRQAYAYFLLSEQPTPNAKKRLLALSNYNALGSGLNLALEDLNLRGAGEILGTKQSGAISQIGFNLYLELLQEMLGQDRLDNEKEVILNTDLEARFTEEYISELAVRLQFYKQLASCQKSEEIEDFTAELIERFGPLPMVSQNLIVLTKYKLRLKKLGVEKGHLRKEWTIIFKDATRYFNPPGFQLFQRLGTKVKYTLNAVSLTVNQQRSFWENLEALTVGLEKIYFQKGL